MMKHKLLILSLSALFFSLTAPNTFPYETMAVTEENAEYDDINVDIFFPKNINYNIISPK